MALAWQAGGARQGPVQCDDDTAHAIHSLPLFVLVVSPEIQDTVAPVCTSSHDLHQVPVPDVSALPYPGSHDSPDAVPDLNCSSPTTGFDYNFQS